MPIIQIDTRQQMNKVHHRIKEKWFIDNGYEVVKSKMLVGDYCIPSNGSVVVDSKKDLQEVYADLIQDHERFRREADLATKAGIKLYILVEEPKIKTLRDVATWQNPRYLRWLKVKKAREQGRAWAMKAKWNPKPPMKSVSLMKAMYTFAEKHGVEWVFCPTAEAGEKIVELLTQERTDE